MIKALGVIVVQNTMIGIVKDELKNKYYRSFKIEEEYSSTYEEIKSAMGEMYAKYFSENHICTTIIYSCELSVNQAKSYIHYYTEI